ncbi:hypothetical protein I5G61_gp48 [Mycobacterium phage Quesadilla]|uniref:Uncharacterized protein n=1 Tax=Mycobacterium phage Quesadilla TaxID=2664226 RepID=A0A5Q2W9W4_9CAUD|nr:hypothetical protein I5G61_gp48 [Mycobacterium phage Quesadilla]QGH75296.1 hypothetical protein SEA_QUESADILLA_48 [Mycobacterium phage Quesadilla]
MGSPFATSTGTIARIASEASASYARSLMMEKALASGTSEIEAGMRIDGWLIGRSQREVSATIDRLKSEGFTGRAKTAAPSQDGIPSAEVVPAGRYAIETEDGATNGLAFYKVDRPEEGKWAGRVFVKLMVSDEEQRMSWAATKSILAKIAEVGAAEASARYGHEIGECGVCGRTLTNDESRERGIGPICAAKNSW